MHFKKSVLIFTVALGLISHSFASDWEVRQHTEKYETKMKRSYYVQKTIDNVRVSNSFSSNGLATIVYKFSAPDLMIFTVYDDGVNNPPRKFYKADYTYYTFTDDKGNEINFAIDTSRGNGNTIKGMNALAVRRMMVNAPYVRGSIQIENITYDFLMNTFEFRNSFIELCEHLGYTEEEIQRAIGHESAIFDTLFRMVCAQMSPYYKNSNKNYKSVNVDMVREAVEDVRDLFPDYIDSILYEFSKIHYREWISFFNMKYNVDITEMKNMDEVEELFTLLTVEIEDISNLGRGRHSPAIESLNKLDKLNGEDLTPEFEMDVPPSQYEEEDDGLAYLKAKDKRANYAKIRSYGVGLNTDLDANFKMENSLSWGFIFESNGFFNKHHGMTFGIGYLNSGNLHGIEQFVGYSYRLPFTKNFEMIVSPSVVLSLKQVPCVATNKVLYGDRVTNNMIGFGGVRVDLGFNWFFKEDKFLTFGVADRLLGPGFTLLERYEEIKPVKYNNVAEGYIGIGLSF